MDDKPVVIPHDRDSEEKHKDANPNETKNEPPQRTRTERQPDGTEKETIIVK